MNAKERTALLDTPPRTRAGAAPSTRRDPVSDLRGEFPSRRSASPRSVDDDPFAPYEDDPLPPRRVPSWPVRVASRLPRSLVGRLASAAFALGGLGAIWYGLYAAHRSLLHDARLTIPSSRSIEISGNNHLTRPQLLSVFGEDVDRNILTVPLAGRRAELEALPWVEHATVMRLLPHNVRVSIVERKPVAFVRQGGEIGLVDAHGVLLDLSPELAADHDYSFPVVTGIAATDPASVREARMKLYLRFTRELDENNAQISKHLSEVDLTDPEDVKALIPDNGTDVLVHFGEEDFLTRYQRYVQNLPDWKAHYPKLASVDMRYEREVVLEMAPGAAVPIGDAAAAPVAVTKAAGLGTGKKALVAKKPAAKPVAKAKPAAAAAPKTSGGHLQQAFDVRSTSVHSKAAPR